MDQIALPHRHAERQMEEYLSEKVRNTGDFQTVANVFRLLDDTSRVRIFWLLCHCEECVMNLSAMVDMSSPAVSHHLRQLKDGGLITGRRDGKEVYYTAADTEQSRLLHRAIEETMEIACPESEEHSHTCAAHPRRKEAQTQTRSCSREQEQTIRAVHEYVLENLERRMTIEALSKKFLMNPTTLKTLFKEVYGQSLALHIREHRMERAAQLLEKSDLSVAEIAAAVGFESQSKFSAAFRQAHSQLPTAFRHSRRKG